MFFSYLLLLFSILISIKANKLLNITDSNIEDYLEKNKGRTILLLFYVNDCYFSQKAIEILDKFETKDSIIEKVAEIDCKNNFVSCMRFNITKVPTIFLLKDDRLFLFTFFLAEETLNAFIAYSHSKENGISLPEPRTYFDLILVLLDESITKITQLIQQFIITHGNGQLKWEKNHTISVIIGSVSVLLLSLGYLMIKCCLKRKKKVKTE